jgi:hypothetical protein
MPYNGPYQDDIEYEQESVDFEQDYDYGNRSGFANGGMQQRLGDLPRPFQGGSAPGLGYGSSQYGGMNSHPNRVQVPPGYGNLQQTEREGKKTRNKKQYVQLDAQGYETGSVFNNSSAYNAALKAASRGSTDIYLLDKGFNNGRGRLYAYKGTTEPIAQHNAFTASRGIQQKARIQAMGYYDLP